MKLEEKLVSLRKAKGLSQMKLAEMIHSLMSSCALLIIEMIRSPPFEIMMEAVK